MPPQPDGDNERAAKDLKKYIAEAAHYLDKSQRLLSETFIQYVEHIAVNPHAKTQLHRHRAHDVLDLMDKAAKIRERLQEIKDAWLEVNIELEGRMQDSEQGMIDTV